MDVGQSVSNLFKYEFCVGLLKFALPFDQFEEITTTSILHDH
jgi:hypothetical protein